MAGFDMGPPFRHGGGMQPILFVCLGNICRSPAAEAVFRARANAAGLDVGADSAGTGSWHLGEAPHSDMVVEAGRRGYDLTGLRARQVARGDFARFGLILAMERPVLDRLLRLAPATGARVGMFPDGTADAPDVPDPWYNGDFAGTLDIIEAGVERLIAGLAR